MIGSVVPGLEVFLAEFLHLVDGRRVGLITNHTGVDRRGASTVDLLDRAGVRLTALFAPEHGIRGVGRSGEPITSSAHERIGIPIYSLYGDTRVPTPRMMNRVDAFVYDIQDIGARTYTYSATMTLTAEAAHRAGKPFVVLDRPNPIRGDLVEGGLADARFRSLTSLNPVPQRYGLTTGELMRFLTATHRLDADVTVVPMQGYKRSMWWEETALRWSAPSPNIRDVDAALLYCGTVFFEASNMSVGRGTDLPFKVVGAPWLDAAHVASDLNGRRLRGVEFVEVRRDVQPGNPYGGSEIPMVHVAVRDRDAVRPVEVGVHMIHAIYARHRAELEWRGNALDYLAGTDALRRALETDRVESLLKAWHAESENFRVTCAAHRLYPV